MEFRNRHVYLEPDDFDFVESKAAETTTPDDTNEEHEILKEEQYYDSDVEYYEDDGEDDDDVDSENEDALKHRPASSEIDKWREAVEALSSRALKNYGVVFHDVDPVPLVEGLDPLPYSCFNCWEMDHFTKDCPEPKVNYCINCGRRGERVYTCPRCSRGQHLLFVEYGRDWRKWKTIKNGGATSGMKGEANEPKESKRRNDAPVVNFKSEKTGGQVSPRQTTGRDTKVHRELPRNDQVDNITSPKLPHNHADSKASLSEEPELLRRDDAKAEKQEVAVQTAQYLSVIKEPISNIEQEKREVVSIAVQTPRYFMPYYRSPYGEYQTVRTESISRISEVHSTRDEVRAVTETIEMPSESERSVKNNPQPEIFGNNKQISLQPPLVRQQQSSPMRYSPNESKEVYHSISTNVSAVEWEYSEALSESPRNELSCRPVTTSTVLRCRERTGRNSYNPPAVRRDEGENRFGSSAKEEECLEVSTGDSKFSEEKNSEEGFRISSVDYYVLLKEIKYLDRRFQEDNVIRDFSLMEIDRILRNCSKI